MPFKQTTQIRFKDLSGRVKSFIRVGLSFLYAISMLSSCNRRQRDLKDILKSTDTVKISNYRRNDTSVYFVTSSKDLDIFTRVINGKQENLPSDTLKGRIQYYSKGHMIFDASLFNQVTIQYVYDDVVCRERISYQAGMYLDQLFSTFASTNEYKDPLSLLKRVHIVDDIGAVTISGNFPDNWIKRSDVETLITLVKNKSKCVCLLDPISSYVPFDSLAEVGGYAIQWIKASKENRNYSFQLYTCPKVDTAEADSLIKWYTERKKERLL
jgi:hypothetical protein